MSQFHSTIHSNKSAFLLGVRQGFGAPAWVLVAGMIGFGAMCRSTGVDIWIATAITTTFFALPGQIVFVESMSMGAIAIATAITVMFTATRFLTMTLTIFPQMDRRSLGKSNFLAVHVLSMSSWAACMKEFVHIPPEYRYAYFIGMGLSCWGVSIPSTIFGYLIAGSVPLPVTYGLLFINPLFFLLTFVDVVLPVNRIAIIFGGLAGIPLYIYFPEQSLLMAGLGCGSLVYFVDLYLRKRQPKQEALN